MSKVRLIAKSMPSKTGGLSSNSGSAWPGTNSTRSIRISIVEGATRTRTPCRWQRSTSSTASAWGKSGSAISTSSTASKWRSSCSSERKSRRPSTSASGRAGDEAVGLDHVRVLERVRDGLDVRARADQHRAAPVAGGAQHRARDALEAPAQDRHVEQREEQRAVEDVVRLERLALDLGVDQDHERDLEQRRDHAREAGPLRAVAVEARAGEQQEHHEPGERRVLLGLAPHLPELLGRDDRRLDHERGVDGEEEADQVERRERRHAREGAQRVEAQDAAEERAACPRERRGRGGRPARLPSAL